MLQSRLTLCFLSSANSAACKTADHSIGLVLGLGGTERHCTIGLGLGGYIAALHDRRGSHGVLSRLHSRPRSPDAPPPACASPPFDGTPQNVLGSPPIPARRGVPAEHQNIVAPAQQTTHTGRTSASSAAPIAFILMACSAAASALRVALRIGPHFGRFGAFTSASGICKASELVPPHSRPHSRDAPPPSPARLDAPAPLAPFRPFRL